MEKLTDRAEIEAYLRRDSALHIYEIGDLDPFFWPHTEWYGLRTPELAALCLVYRGCAQPTLLALARGERVEPLKRLVTGLGATLPPGCYAHASGPIVGVLPVAGRHGRHLKMRLADRAALDAIDISEAEPLSVADLEPLQAFYARSYPRNWFEPRMLETGCYVGLREGGRLVAVAGVHVYSPRYGVAALGNIATEPACRGRGLAGRVTGALCQRLLETVEIIGLNVAADNEAAIACYRRLGFELVAEYEELTLTAEPG